MGWQEGGLGGAEAKPGGSGASTWYRTWISHLPDETDMGGVEGLPPGHTVSEDCRCGPGLLVRGGGGARSGRSLVGAGADPKSHLASWAGVRQDCGQGHRGGASLRLGQRRGHTARAADGRAPHGKGRWP